MDLATSAAESRLREELKQGIDGEWYLDQGAYAFKPPHVGSPARNLPFGDGGGCLLRFWGWLLIDFTTLLQQIFTGWGPQDSQVAFQVDLW